MTYADWDFYKNEFHGITITDSSEYLYFAEGAGDELAPFFVSRVPNTDEAQYALKRCACRIADIIYGDFKTSKYGMGGAKITSESVSGYYTVSYTYGASSGGTSPMRHAINTAIALYLGKYVLGAVKVTW